MNADLLTGCWAQPGPPALTPRQWETLLGQARQARLLSRLALKLQDSGGLAEVPAGPRRHLESGLRIGHSLRQQVRWELGCIERALESVPGAVVLLKGAAYVAADLPPSRGRLFGDVDILVERARLPQVENALFAAGWIGTERDAYNQRFYREWMHEIPPLQHVQRGTAIDVHHTITPPTSRMRVEGARLLARAQPAGDGSRFKILAPADMVLHSAVHLFQEGEFGHGLRDLLDLDDLLRHFGAQAGFWSGLFERARDLGLGVPLHHALHHARRLYATPVPPEMAAQIEGLRPDWPARAVMAALLAQALRPHHPSCEGPFTGLSRWLLYVRAHALRMPMRLVVPHLLRKAWMHQFPPRESPVRP